MLFVTHSIYVLIIAVALLAALTEQQAVWTSSADFQCGSVAMMVQPVEGSTTTTVSFQNSFYSPPAIALSTIGLVFDPTTTQINYFANCGNCVSGQSTCSFVLNIYLSITSDDSFINIRVGYLAVNQEIFPNVFIDYAEYQFTNLSVGSGSRVDSSLIDGSSTAQMNDGIASTYACFISGYDADVIMPFDILVSGIPIPGESQKFNFTAVTAGNGIFRNIVLYRVVFENNLTVSALNGSLYGSQSTQTNFLQPIQFPNSFFNGLVGFGFNSPSGVQYNLTQDRTQLDTGFTFQNLTYRYLYVNVQLSCQQDNPNCTCQIYYYYNSATEKCQQICGDSKLFTLQCDDGNTVDGDGCSSVCDIESQFQCLYGAAMTASSCYPEYTIAFESSNISPSSPTVLLVYLMFLPVTQDPPTLTQFSIAPRQIILQSMNYNSQTGSLVLSVSSNEQSTEETEVTLRYNGEASPVFGGELSASFMIPTQNLNPLPPVPPTPTPTPQKFDQSAYSMQQSLTVAAQFLVYSNLFSFVLGLFGCKLIAVEMTSVIQISFYALTTITNPNPPFLALYSMKYVSGPYLNLNLPSHEISSAYQSLGLSSNFLNNFNLMIISFLLCPLLSLIFHLLSKHSKSLNTNKKMKSYFWESLCDLLFSICIFNTMSITTSLIINFRFTENSAGSIVMGFIMVLVLLAEIVVFNMFTKKYKEFKEEFQPGIKGYIYPSLLNSQNILVGIMAGVGSAFIESIFIMMVGTLALTLFVGIMKPYLNSQHYVRQLINLTITLIILSIYIGYGQSSKQTPSHVKSTFSLPIIVIVLLFVVLIMNLGFILKHIAQQVLIPWFQEMKEQKALKEKDGDNKKEGESGNAPLLDPIQEIEMQLMTTMKGHGLEQRKKGTNLMNRKLLQKESNKYKSKEKEKDNLSEISEKAEEGLIDNQLGVKENQVLLQVENKGNSIKEDIVQKQQQNRSQKGENNKQQVIQSIEKQQGIENMKSVKVEQQNQKETPSPADQNQFPEQIERNPEQMEKEMAQKLEQLQANFQ